MFYARDVLGICLCFVFASLCGVLLWARQSAEACWRAWAVVAAAVAVCWEKTTSCQVWKRLTAQLQQRSTMLNHKQLLCSGSDPCPQHTGIVLKTAELLL